MRIAPLRSLSIGYANLGKVKVLAGAHRAGDKCHAQFIKPWSYNVDKLWFKQVLKKSVISHNSEAST